jgi:hypothetical protein
MFFSKFPMKATFFILQLKLVNNILLFFCLVIFILCIIKYPTRRRVNNLETSGSLQFDGFQCLDILQTSHLNFKKGSGRAWFLKKTPRTLFFEDQNYIDVVMDRHLFHLFCAALNLEKSLDQVALWGPGWPGWNRSLTISENIQRRWPDNYFDLVITRHNPGAIGLKSVVYMTYRHECVYNEISFNQKERWYCTWSEGYSGKGRYPWLYFDIVLLTYKDDVLQLKKKYKGSLENNTFIQYWPHAALPGPFLKTIPNFSNFNDRPFDVCLIGCTDPILYPQRHMIKKWMDERIFHKAGLRAMTLPHFGYTELSTRAETISRNISAFNLEVQYANYVKFIGNCKSILVTRSIRNYDLRKYTEVAMGGTLMVGNVPLSTNFWDPFVVDVDKFLKTKDAKGVAYAIKRWLSPKMEDVRTSRLYEARTTGMKHRSFQQRWREIRNIYHRYKNGERGFFV